MVIYMTRKTMSKYSARMFSLTRNIFLLGNVLFDGTRSIIFIKTYVVKI